MKQIEHTDPLIEKTKEAKKSLAGAQAKIATVIKSSDAMGNVMTKSARELSDLSNDFGEDLLVRIVTFPKGQKQVDVVSVKKHLAQIAQNLRNAAI